MKKTVLAAFGALFAMAGLHSCLDFDMPTDTFTGGDTELDPIVYKGKADSIDYRKEISEEGCYADICIDTHYRTIYIDIQNFKG